MSEKNISFEDALAKLEKTVASLEGGEMSLNASVDAYEEARKLIVTCEERLEDAKQRVYILNKNEFGVSAAKFDKSSDEN